MGIVLDMIHDLMFLLFTKNGYGLLTKLEVKIHCGWVLGKMLNYIIFIYLFLRVCVFMERDAVEVHRQTKKFETNIQAFFTEDTWSICRIFFIQCVACIQDTTVFRQCTILNG